MIPLYYFCCCASPAVLSSPSWWTNCPGAPACGPLTKALPKAWPPEPDGLQNVLICFYIAQAWGPEVTEYSSGVQSTREQSMVIFACGSN